MLSSDKNVESIAQLIEVLKHYLGIQAEYVKLDVIDKVVRLLKGCRLGCPLFLYLHSGADVFLVCNRFLALCIYGIHQGIPHRGHTASADFHIVHHLPQDMD